MSIDDIDAVEINEAFAPVVLRGWRNWAPTPSGSIRTAAPSHSDIRSAAPGHDDDLATARARRPGGRYGLQTMCEAGQANVTTSNDSDRDTDALRPDHEALP